MRHRFKTSPGDPAPISLTIKRTVRFEEVDSMGIVWHGRYFSYFEDARVALGDYLGLGYLDYYGKGVLAPIKETWADYLKPLRFGETAEVTATLHYTEAARINTSFSIVNEKGETVTRGYSIQLLLDAGGTVLLLPPPFHAEAYKRWKEGGTLP